MAEDPYVHVVHFAPPPKPRDTLRHVLGQCCYCQPEVIEEDNVVVFVHEPTPENIDEAREQLRKLLRRNRRE